MPIYKIGSETFELDSPKEAAFIATKMGGVDFKEMAPRVGKLTPASAGPQSVEDSSTYEYGTPGGRRGRVVSSTVPGSIRPLTPEEDASRFAQSAQDRGETVDMAEAVFPRLSSSVRNADGLGAAALPRHAWQITKDFASFPGRLMDYGVRSTDYDYDPSNGQARPEATLANALGDPTGATYMQEDASGATRFMGDILRDPIAGAGAVAAPLMQGLSLPGRLGANLAMGLAPRSLDRAVDYDPNSNMLPTTGELYGAGAMALVPEVIGEAGARYAPRLGANAKSLFMSQVKALPGKRNRQVWEAMDKFSDNPAYMREVIGDRSRYNDLAQGWREGTDARQGQVEPLYDAMEAVGVRVPVEAALTGMRAEMARVGRGAATGADRAAAASEMEHLLTQPDPTLFPFGAQGADVLPVLSYAPREARGIKSDAYGRVKDWNDPTSTVKSAAAGGAGRGIKEFLESADETGTLAAKNREWGDWLGTEEAFLRMESRVANKNAPKIWQVIKRARENPQSVKHLLDAERALMNAKATAISASPLARALMFQGMEE